VKSLDDIFELEDSFGSGKVDCEECKGNGKCSTCKGVGFHESRGE